MELELTFCHFIVGSWSGLLRQWTCHSYLNLLSKVTWVVNGITRAAPAYFLTTFVITFGEIFLKYHWNVFEKVFKKFFKKIKKFLHIILLRSMLKYWQKNHLILFFKSIYKSFYCLKNNLQCLMSAFVYFLLIGLISNYLTCPHDILKIQWYKKILQFQHQIKLLF
jgi:hypothetical protein